MEPSAAPFPTSVTPTETSAETIPTAAVSTETFADTIPTSIAVKEADVWQVLRAKATSLPGDAPRLVVEAPPLMVEGTMLADVTIAAIENRLIFATKISIFSNLEQLEEKQ